jgi:hypothetical protein
MTGRKRPVLLLALTATWQVLPISGQEADATKGRQIRIPSANGEPALTLQISAEGRRGAVSVRDQNRGEVQTLVCPLLRGNPAPTETELAGVREQFVLRFEAQDLDFDGHKDLMGVRDFGAKWGRYCVWLYDPKQHIFVTDFLAEQMELLANLSPGGSGLIFSSHLAPTDPWWAVYRIAGASGSRPERQLVPAYSCLVETADDGSSPKTVVKTRYEGGQAIVRRREAAHMDLASAFAMCSSFGKSPGSQKSQAKK